MVAFFSIETLLTLVIGGIIGFFSSIVLQGRLFKRQDREKLAEEVYGKLYPLLERATMRDTPGEDNQWPGTFWLSAPEIIMVDAIMVKYSNLIPSKIKSLWFEAKKHGPELGPDDAHSDNIYNVFDLENLLNEIDKEIRK